MLKLDDVAKLHHARRVMENAQYEARQEAVKEIDDLEAILVERTAQAILDQFGVEEVGEKSAMIVFLVREAIRDAYNLRDYARDFGIQ